MMHWTYYVGSGVHINKSIFEKILLKIEKIAKTFSFSNKLFPKLVYYCVLLGHTLVKSYYVISSWYFVLLVSIASYCACWMCILSCASVAYLLACSNDYNNMF